MPDGANATVSTNNENQPDQNRGPVVIAVTLWLLGFSTIFVGLRIVSRLGIIKKWSWDDSFIVLAWILAFGFSFSICWGVRNGLGLHEQYVLPQNEGPLRGSEYAFSVLYNPVLMATKTSILLFYLTLSKPNPRFKRATIATLVIVIIAGLALTLLNVLQCNPVWTAFETVTPSFARCTDVVTLYLASAPVNIVTDLCILILPFPLLTRMRLPKKQKIILVITFSFGAFVAAVDVVRIAYLQQAFQLLVEEVGQANATSSKLTVQVDFSWYASLSFMWSAIEVHVGIICACVPSLKPLVARVLPSMLRDTSNPHDISDLHHESRTDPTGVKPEPPGPLSPLPPVALSQGRPEAKSNLVENDRKPLDNSHAHLHIQPANESAPFFQGEENDKIDFMAFLAAPGSSNYDGSQSTCGALAATTTTTTNKTSQQDNAPFFDFYNMEKKKPMTRLSNKQSYAPLVAVTILFFIWGVAYGLLSVLNSQFALVTSLTDRQAVGLHAAYYGAYFVGPLTVGRYFLIRFGFKATFVCGLCIYAVGTLIFWPSAVLGSFIAFIVCNFIVGFGVSILEVAANPFIALCGPPQYAETRLNLSQGLQAIGTVVSPLLAQKVLFKSVIDSESLIDVQWAYLGLAFFAVALAVLFFYLPLPEASDEDFEAVAEQRESINSAKLFGTVRVVDFTLAMAVVAQFLYVGAQESASQVYQDYVVAVDPASPLGPFDWQTVGHTVFAAGRFACAGLGLFIKPRLVLLMLWIGMIVTSSLAMVLSGPAGIAMITLYELFQSGVFPLIFAIALRGLGSRTKLGAVYLTAAISGGAPFPVLITALSDSSRGGARYSFCVVVAQCAAGIVFPLCLTASSKARKQVDPVYKEEVETVRSGQMQGESKGRLEGKKRLASRLFLREQDLGRNC